MKKLVPLAPLLASAALLMFGNGLQGTLIAWRATSEGIPTWQIGIITAAYFFGFAAGCFHLTHILNAIGHIRAFSAMAAIATASIILAGLVVDPWLWLVLRLVSGYCLAVLFAVVESWLNAKVENAVRARTLSVYRYVDLAANTSAQYFLPWFGGDSFVLFGISAIALCLSLTPISLADRSSPAPPDRVRFDLRYLWVTSPLAAIGCIAVGMTNTVYRSLGAVYCHELGFSTETTAWFLAASIISGVVLQYPFGHYSDRRDRRSVIMVATAGGLLASLLLFSSPAPTSSSTYRGSSCSAPSRCRSIRYVRPMPTTAPDPANSRSFRRRCCSSGLPARWPDRGSPPPSWAGSGRNRCSRSRRSPRLPCLPSR
jgi:MFS family permease